MPFLQGFRLPFVGCFPLVCENCEEQNLVVLEENGQLFEPKFVDDVFLGITGHEILEESGEIFIFGLAPGRPAIPIGEEQSNGNVFDEEVIRADIKVDHSDLSLEVTSIFQGCRSLWIKPKLARVCGSFSIFWPSSIHFLRTSSYWHQFAKN